MIKTVERERGKRKIEMAFADFYCEICSLKFEKRSIFNIHLSIAHKEMVERKEDQTSNISKKEPDETGSKTLLQCEICSKTFSKAGNMKIHITSVHDRKRPFKCEI